MSRSPEVSDATPLADTVRDIGHATDQAEAIRKAKINRARRLYFARGLGVVLEHLNFEEEKTVPREITPYLRRLSGYVNGVPLPIKESMSPAEWMEFVFEAEEVLTPPESELDDDQEVHHGNYSTASGTAGTGGKQANFNGEKLTSFADQQCIDEIDKLKMPTTSPEKGQLILERLGEEVG